MLWHPTTARPMMPTSDGDQVGESAEGDLTRHGMLRILIGGGLLLAILDIILLFLIGIRLGFVPVFAIVVLPGLIGGGVARMQRADHLHRTREDLARGVPPSTDLLDAGMLLVASLFLLYPGPVTTALGIVLLIPWPRRMTARFLLRWLVRTLGGGVHMGNEPPAPFGPSAPGTVPLDADGLKSVQGEDLGTAAPTADRENDLPRLTDGRGSEQDG